MLQISHEELNQKIKAAGNQVGVGKIYRHYKYPERKYQVQNICIQEATLKVCIIYKDINETNPVNFVRDLDSWLEKVEWEGKIIPRFLPDKST